MDLLNAWVFEFLDVIHFLRYYYLITIFYVCCFIGVRIFKTTKPLDGGFVVLLSLTNLCS
ncbi:MAG: hypothetical protein DRI56_01340 [Chloroflexota bacterium]|nr:MAG: hypothetical protein DRI56_01340 [Chloroflexota bacterium]